MTQSTKRSFPITFCKAGIYSSASELYPRQWVNPISKLEEVLKNQHLEKGAFHKIKIRPLSWCKPPYSRRVTNINQLPGNLSLAIRPNR